MAGLPVLCCVPASAGDDFHEFAFLYAALHELDFTIGLGKQRVVLAASHIPAGMKMRAPLPDKDVAGQHAFATVALDTKSFRL